MSRLVCQTCGAPVPFDEPVPRDSECVKCGTDLRCCRNCRHWDVRHGNQCTEPDADLVRDKTRRNFCEFFYFSRSAFVDGDGPSGAGASRDRAAEARARLNELFKKKGGEGEGVR